MPLRVARESISATSRAPTNSRQSKSWSKESTLLNPTLPRIISDYDGDQSEVDLKAFSEKTPAVERVCAVNQYHASGLPCSTMHACTSSTHPHVSERDLSADDRCITRMVASFGSRDHEVVRLRSAAKEREHNPTKFKAAD